MSEYEAKQIYFPTLKAMNTKIFQEVKAYGRYDTDYHWFNLPHHLEFKQNIQVTIYWKAMHLPSSSVLNQPLCTLCDSTDRVSDKILLA